MSTWILIPGHGGISPGGIYLTRGKRSPEIPPGFYEGVFNRQICKKVEDLCLHAGISCISAIPGPMNPSLNQRISYCNAMQRKLKNCFVISVHANAAGSDGNWHDARGTVVFHAPNCDQKSVDLAQTLVTKIAESCPPLPSRGVKVANFAMVRKTKCPAVLLECGFMDNIEDATYLSSSAGQDQLANAIYSSISVLNN